MNSLATNRPAMFRYPWMFGRQYDLFFFFISFFLGLVFILITSPLMNFNDAIMLALIVNAFGLGPFHQGPTWFAYLDSQNQAHWKKDARRKAIFYLGPPIIFVVSILGVFKFPGLLAGIWIVWSIQHLVQQNVGILLLYHNYKANEVIVSRPIEAKSQQIVAVYFTLLFWRRCLMKPGANPVVDTAIFIAAIVAAALVIIYLIQTIRQIKKGKAVNVPAFVFWVMSVICLSPLAFWGKEFSAAFLAPLIWHWWQYIGLNYKLVKNKYTGERISNLPWSNSILLFVLVCGVLMLTNLSLIVAKGFLPGNSESVFLTDIFIALLFGFGFSHYFLDAFLWRFREPYQRETVLPYLKIVADR